MDDVCQSGSRCEQITSVPSFGVGREGKTILDEDARKAVGAWVARLTGQGFVLSVLAKNCDCQTDPRQSLHGGTFCDSIFVALSCSRGEFSPDGLYDYSWASVTPMAGNFITKFSQYKSDVRCVCMFADLFFPGEVSFRYFALTGNGATATHSLVKMFDVIKKEDDECTLLNSGVTTCIRFPDQFNSD